MASQDRRGVAVRCGPGPPGAAAGLLAGSRAAAGTIAGTVLTLGILSSTDLRGARVAGGALLLAAVLGR